MDETLLRGVVASWNVLEVDVWDISRLEKRMMIVRRWGVTAVEHGILHGRSFEFCFQSVLGT